MIGYLAARDFENELNEELGASVIARHGRLFLCESALPFRPAWAQNVWFDPEVIDFTSISDAAKKLKALGKWWTQETSPEAAGVLRRAQLIQEQLPKWKLEPIDFLSPLPQKPLSAWMILESGRLLAAGRTESPYPSGEVAFRESKTAPSRAYLKLWELFTAFGVRPQQNEHCLELGASPGGWTWVLAELGCKVTAVDRSPLAPHVAKRPGVKFQSGNAFAIRPDDIGKIDWLFSDLICFPQQLEELIAQWLKSGLVRNLVCTIKFKGETDHAATARLRAIPGARVQHMSHNKHELTWWLVRDNA